MLLAEELVHHKVVTTCYRQVYRHQTFVILRAELYGIAGVAVAIHTGGPGAVIWMMLIGLLGMTAKFNECTLAMVYRKVRPDGTVDGGPMHYLEIGLQERGFPFSVARAELMLTSRRRITYTNTGEEKLF